MIRSLYVEGNSLVHRVPLPVKLVVLCFLAIALFLVRSPWLLAPVPVVAAIVYLSTGQSARQALSRLKPVFFTVLLVAFFSLIAVSPQEAALQILRLTALMLFAAAVTATTTVNAFISTITSAARPLERLGLCRADDIGLAFGLVVRFVPEIMVRYAALRDAHKARGLRLRPFTLISPLIILTLREADQIAQAIDARSLRRR